MRYKGIILKLTKNRAIVTSDDFQCYYLKEVLQFMWEGN